MDEKGKRGKRKEESRMAVSVGVILNVKGKTANKILSNLEKPDVNKHLLDKCAKIAQKLKEK